MLNYYFRVAGMLALTKMALAINCASAETLAKSDLSNKLDAILENHSCSLRTTVTLKVKDLDSGEVLYDRGGDRLLTPASNLKIYTSACALDRFGPEHRFQTTLATTGVLQNGVLHGDLILTGGGDSMFTSSDLADLADRVTKELKLSEICGEVVVDNSRYASPLKGPGWMWDDDPDYYNMSITPLMVDFNVLSLRLTPNEQGISAQLAIPSSYPEIKYLSRKTINGDHLATRRPFTHPILVAQKGNLDEEQDLRLSMHNPGAWVRGMFTAMLSDRGVRISLPDETNHTSSTVASQEFNHLGPSLVKTLNHFNNQSENAVGEVLLHEIAIAKGTKRPRWPDGAVAITKWLEETAGLEPDSFRLVDGSGLSRYNLISADSSVRLLEFMHHHEHAATFYSALKTYEVEVEGKKQPLVAAKPGGMASVSTISGYLKTPSGRLLAFSLLANGFIGSANPVFELREQVWETLAPL